MQNWQEYNNYRRFRNADGTYTYAITVDGETVEVSRELYTEYAAFARKMKYMELDLKRDRVRQDEHGRAVTGPNGIPAILPEREVSLEKLIDGDWDYPSSSPSPEEILIRWFEISDLHRCLASLSAEDRALMQALFFEGKTEREYAAETGNLQQTIHARKRVALTKLKKLLEKQK